MKFNKLRTLTNEELIEKLKMFREELFKLRFHHAMGQLKKTAQIPQIKHIIARILTVLTERK